MNFKKIIFSFGTIALVAVAVVGGTGAFFQDTETSEGNIFVAGSIDLKVDHLKQTYNGEDCTTRCNHWAVEVTEFSQGDRKDGSDVLAERSDPTDALGAADTTGTTPDVPFPTGFVSLGFGGSITLHFPDGIDDGPGDDLRIWEGTGGNGGYPDEQILVEVSPNGFDWTTVDVDPDNVTFDGTVEIDLDGDAPLVYYVRITDISNPDIHNNNADAYDLDAIEAIHCNNELEDGIPSELWQCQLWEETDLNDSHSFFNFSDVKPGDWGRNVVSLHVFDNDAYACLIAHEAQDNENTVYEPELPDTDEAGELQNYLNFFTWQDADADGEYDAGENALNQLNLGNTTGNFASYDSENGLFLTATTTEYIGVAWCAGTLTVDGNDIVCDGSGVHNDAQSDSFVASLTAYTEQHRNNGGFVCGDVQIPEPMNPPGGSAGITADDLALSFSDVLGDPTKWLFYNDTDDTVMTLNQFSSTGGVNDIVTGPESVGAAQMTLHSDPASPRYNIATYQFFGTKLADINSLKYRIYDGSPSGETPFLHFNVSFDGIDSWQRRLVMVPTSVAVSTWTTVDALDGGSALWIHSGSTWPVGLVDGTGTTPGTTPRSWSDILANYPDAQVRDTDSFFGVRVGHPGPAGETGYVDWIEFDGTLFDFEN